MYLVRNPRIRLALSRSHFCTLQKVKQNYSAETIADIVSIKEYLTDFTDENQKVLKLDDCDEALRKRFFLARKRYREEEERLTAEFSELMQVWQDRSRKAVAALPTRLRFQAQCQIDKSWDFPTPTEFPPAYDPGNLFTSPAHVRSTFEYSWKPGDDVSLFTNIRASAGGTTGDARSFLLDEEISEIRSRGSGTIPEAKGKEGKEHKKESKEDKETLRREQHERDLRNKKTKMMVEEWRKKFNVKLEKKSKIEERGVQERQANVFTPDTLPTFDELLADPATTERFFEQLPGVLKEMTATERKDFIDGFRMLYHKLKKTKNE